MPRSDHARLFAALDVPEQVAEPLCAWAREVARARRGRDGSGGLRVLAPESIHLTLIFLGERPLSLVEELAGAMRTAAEGLPACEVRLGAPLWLPPRRPRTLAVEAQDGSGTLAALQRAVAEGLREVCGEARRHERFRAHVTVARTKPDGGRGGELPVTPALRFAAAEAVLYRSHLEPEGARYERLAAAPLLGGA